MARGNQSSTAKKHCPGSPSPLATKRTLHRVFMQCWWSLYLEVSHSDPSGLCFGWCRRDSGAGFRFDVSPGGFQTQVPLDPRGKISSEPFLEFVPQNGFWIQTEYRSLFLIKSHNIHTKCRRTPVCICYSAGLESQSSSVGGWPSCAFPTVFQNSQQDECFLFFLASSRRTLESCGTSSFCTLNTWTLFLPCVWSHCGEMIVWKIHEGSFCSPGFHAASTVPKVHEWCPQVADTSSHGFIFSEMGTSIEKLRQNTLVQGNYPAKCDVNEIGGYLTECTVSPP